MTAFPKARRGAPEVELDGVTASVLKAADGATAVAAIAERLGVGRETVWTALDRLADLGLLAERAGPPAGLPTISRRAALGLTGAGAGLGLAAIALPAAAASESEVKHSREQAIKRSTMTSAMSSHEEQESKRRDRSVEQTHKSEERALEQKRKRHPLGAHDDHDRRGGTEQDHKLRARADESGEKKADEQRQK